MIVLKISTFTRSWCIRVRKLMDIAYFKCIIYSKFSGWWSSLAASTFNPFTWQRTICTPYTRSKNKYSVLHPGDKKQSVPLALDIFEPTTTTALLQYIPNDTITPAFLKLPFIVADSEFQRKSITLILSVAPWYRMTIKLIFHVNEWMAYRMERFKTA